MRPALTIPSAGVEDPAREVGGRLRLVPLVTLVASVVVVVAVWPEAPFSSAPRPGDALEDLSVEPPPAPMVAMVEGPLWEPVAALPDGVDRVVGVGELVLAVSPGSMWPVALLEGGAWHVLAGLPIGFDPSPTVAVPLDAGFAVVGTTGDRTIVLEFTRTGRFLGTRTVKGLVAGGAASVAGDVVVFDNVEPRGVRVGESLEVFETPGPVTDAAAAADGGLYVLLEDGSAHASTDGGRSWRLVATELRAIESAGPVVGIGRSASVGMQLLGEDAVTLDRSPFGPSVGLTSGIAVHVGPTESLWVSDLAGGWDRVPLWRRHGFTDRFVEMVGGTERPAVVGVGADGVRTLWVWDV